MDIEHGAQTVARISMEVASVSLLGALVEVVILRDQLFKLRLNVEYLLRRELVLDHRYARLLQVPQE